MFKVLTEGCEPKRATKYSAAVDLFAAEDVVIKAGETAKVRLGVCIKIERDFLEKYAITRNIKDDGMDFGEYYDDLRNDLMSSHYLQLEPRSSLRAKGLIAGTGIIDLDYKDEIMIILHNPIGSISLNLNNERSGLDDFLVYGANENYAFKINKGDKIAQIMLCEHKSYLMGYESEEERVGGFGSSGK